jgi:predicted dehydrogenase
VVKDEPLLDVGTHLIDLASWLTGSAARRVRARTLTPRGCRLELELERGVAAISCANDRLYSEGVKARDAEGASIAAATRGGLVDAVRSRIRGDASPLLESLSAELTAFCRAVQSERLGSDPDAAGHLATAGDGAAAMAVVEGARRSADSGGDWFDVSPAAPRN